MSKTGFEVKLPRMGTDGGVRVFGPYDAQEEAEAMCREMVVFHLQQAFDREKCWSTALYDFLDNEDVQPWVEGSEELKVFCGDFAREWVVQHVRQDWPAIRVAILAREPEVQRSWFRWLHHVYLKLGWHRRPGAAPSQEWRAVEIIVASRPDLLDPLLILHMEACAWEIGLSGLRRLGTLAWDRISFEARGRFLAGYSNPPHYRSPDQLPALELRPARWIESRLPEAVLTAESMLELACNAVRQRDLPLFCAALGHDPSTLNESVRRMEPFRQGLTSESSFSKDAALLSNRVVDMALEACLHLGWAEGAGCALKHGANPDLRVWTLQRSWNQHYSALGFTIEEEHLDVAESLLAAGAHAAGPGGSKALFLAICKGADSMAMRLLEMGASFDQGDKPEWPGASQAGDDNVEREHAMRFNSDQKSMDTAKRLGDGLPLVHVSKVAWFYRGNAQGGAYYSMLTHFLYRDDVERLQIYEAKGLPLNLTLPDLSILLTWGAYNCLCWIMHRSNSPASVMWRIRREIPAFGTSKEPSKINLNKCISDDTSRRWAHLQADCWRNTIGFALI